MEKLYDISEYRKKIDEVDKKICELLKERMGLIKEVKTIKRKHVKTGSTIRPARAVEVINNAVKNLFPFYPKIGVTNIWRNLISSSEYHEQEFSIIALNQECYWLGREFYGNFINNTIEENIEKFINYLDRNKTHFGFVPFPKKGGHDKWWTYLVGSKIKVFAITQPQSENQALSIGHVMLEPTTEEDFTLIATHNLEEIKQDYRIIDVVHTAKNCKDLYLVELSGFYNTDESSTIGSYPLIK